MAQGGLQQAGFGFMFDVDDMAIDGIDRHPHIRYQPGRFGLGQSWPVYPLYGWLQPARLLTRRRTKMTHTPFHFPAIASLLFRIQPLSCGVAFHKPYRLLKTQVRVFLEEVVVTPGLSAGALGRPLLHYFKT